MNSFSAMFGRFGMSSSNPSPWLLKFIRHPERTRSAWQHLLVLRALRLSLLDLRAFAEASPIYDRRERCPNPVCPQRREATLRDIARRGGRVRRLVCAACGYTFVMGATKRVIDYGPVWRQRLVRLWTASLSTRQIAEQLGCDSLTAVRHAHDLGLEFPRTVDGRETRLRSPHTPLNFKVTSSGLRKRRLRWTLAKTKSSSLEEARKLAQRDYAWLRRHDLSWLKQNLPKKHLPYSPRVDDALWEKRENELLVKIVAALPAIKARHEPPTKSSIARELGATHLIPAKLERMPKLDAVIRRASSD